MDRQERQHDLYEPAKLAVQGESDSQTAPLVHTDSDISSNPRLLGALVVVSLFFALLHTDALCLRVSEPNRKGAVPTFFRTWAMLGTFFILIDYAVRVIPDVINAPLTGPFFKGGVCATAAWWVAWPFELVKSKVQASQGSSSPGTLTVMRGIVAEKGVLGLYRGIGPGSLRSLFANGCSMIVYSFGQQLRDGQKKKAMVGAPEKEKEGGKL